MIPRLKVPTELTEELYREIVAVNGRHCSIIVVAIPDNGEIFGQPTIISSLCEHELPMVLQMLARSSGFDRVGECDEGRA